MGPSARPHQRYLPAQEIRADVERDLTPLADETGGPGDEIIE